jgi:hypothetical protein
MMILRRPGPGPSQRRGHQNAWWRPVPTRGVGEPSQHALAAGPGVGGLGLLNLNGGPSQETKDCPEATGCQCCRVAAAISKRDSYYIILYQVI